MRVVAILLLFPCIAMASPPDAPSVATVRNNLQDLIVGRWQVEDYTIQFEFATNGVLTIFIGPAKRLSGKYRFLADDIMEWKVEMPAEAKGATKVKVEIKGDELFTNLMNEKAVMTSRRVK